jgi:hypothetical protein
VANSSNAGVASKHAQQNDPMRRRRQAEPPSL